MAVAVATMAAGAYDVGLIVEKRAIERLPMVDARRPVALLRTVVKAPAWLAGFAIMLTGLGLQVVALTIAPVSVVQPVLGSGLIILMVLSRVTLRERLSRTELACVFAMAVAITCVALSATGADRAGQHASGGWVAVVVVPSCLLGLLLGWKSLQPVAKHRAPVLGVGYGLASGVLYGVAGLAIKALAAVVMVRHFGLGVVVALIATPYPYLACGCSTAGLLLFQTALQRCRVSIVAPVSNITGSVYVIVAGTWLFAERLPNDPIKMCLRLAGAIAVAVAVVVLSMQSAGKKVAARSNAAAKPAVGEA